MLQWNATCTKIGDHEGFKVKWDTKLGRKGRSIDLGRTGGRRMNIHKIYYMKLSKG